MTGEFKSLARYRATGGKISFMSSNMDSEQLNGRRRFIRALLKNSVFANRSNAEIDQMRLTVLDSGGCLVEDPDGYEFLVPVSGIPSSEVAYRRERSGMPERFCNVGSDDFQWSIYEGRGSNVNEQKNIIVKYLTEFEKFEKEGIGLYIWSNMCGSGKTMLSCAILNELAKRCKGSFKFVSTLDLLERTKSSFNSGLAKEEIETLYDCRVLVLDDIGAQLGKEWADTVLYHLVNDRHTKKRVTIYTSNLDIQKLNVGDRVVARISDDSVKLHLPEVSFRSVEASDRKNRLLYG